jgi:hypothetical protein
MHGYSTWHQQETVIGPRTYHFIFIGYSDYCTPCHCTKSVPCGCNHNLALLSQSMPDSLSAVGWSTPQPLMER